MAMKHIDYVSLKSRYGFDEDVRASYAHLPFQALWTWITGKSLNSAVPKLPKETWLKEWQLWGQLAWSWSLIISSVLLGAIAHRSEWPLWQKLLVYCTVWVLVTNRTRGLLHTFHYTNHGAGIENMRRARWIATMFMSIPILHTAWRNYHKIHAEVHHSRHDLCTDRDPDQQFMMQHGFYNGMPEWQYWAKLVYAPFLPSNIWAHFWFRVQQNFIKPGLLEISFRILFWVAFFSLAIHFDVLTELALFYLLPLILLTQHSSWLQHTTEHLWFPVYPKDTSPFVVMGAMTWGRFLGRPYPHRVKGVLGIVKRMQWWLAVVLIDIPIRLYAFMQDLPSHDFHHRSPRVNFWHIASERAANEGLPSKYGPMTETWGLVESWLILRDHLCRGIHDPFGVYAWDKRMRESRSSNLKADLADVPELSGG
jgi:hypothetical protein